MTDYHYTMTILKTKQEIRPDGTLGPPIQIAGFTKPIHGSLKKGKKKQQGLDSEIQEAEEI